MGCKYEKQHPFVPPIALRHKIVFFYHHMGCKYEKQHPFVPPIAPSWQSDEFYRRMDSETMNRPVPSHKFRTHTLARDHILVALYKLASNPSSILVPLNIWLALMSFYCLASSTLALDNLVFANWSFHHRSYAVIDTWLAAMF